GKLLIGGIVPGLVLAVLFCVSIYIIARFFPCLITEKKAEGGKPALGEKCRSLLGLWQIWVVAVVIFGGIFGGVFNPSEAAAVASVVLMVILAVTNFSRPKKLWAMYKESFIETAGTTCMIFLVMGGASVFSQFLVISGLTDAIAGWAAGLQISPVLLVVVIVFVYAGLGTLLDSISMLCITVPVFNPIVDSLGVDPLWYAIVVILTIHVGLVTPPVGLNVYGAYAVAEKDVSLEDIFLGVAPFFAAMLLTIFTFFLFPTLATFLPNVMMDA
ncbi:MAG: TRAP transporter large permease subunit, partial [Desulfovibrio sp.]|nr:TRAP transporter large permease subunit [Desulfovibrio sp.]